MKLPRRMPLAEWPAGDRVAWQLACQAPNDLFDEAGAAHELRPLTRRNYESAYATWLTHLKQRRAPAQNEKPAARVTQARLDGWVQSMRAAGRTNGTIRQYIVNLYSMMRLIAPEADLGFMLKPRGQPLSVWLPVEPKPAPPVDVEDVMNHVRILHRQALVATSPFDRRGKLRDAALLALWAMLAPRVSNLAMMRLNRHLQPAIGNTFEIYFRPGEMKGVRSLHLALDAECSGFMRDYLDKGRGLFEAAADTDAVWLGQHGKPLKDGGVAALVRRHTLAWFGEEHGPHVARKWLSNSAARRSAEAAFDAAEVCGHSVSVSLDCYRDAIDTGAARRHGLHIQELRRGTALLAERAFARNRDGLVPSAQPSGRPKAER